jgi:hypothetical protein
VALAIVSRSMRARGADLTLKLHVVEGRDRGAILAMVEEGRFYLVGRGSECELPLADPDVSREHVRIARRGSSVVVRDLGTKNGTWIGDTRASAAGDIVWKPVHMMKIGRTVLALEEPLGDSLAYIEKMPDEPLSQEEVEAPPAEASPGDASAHAANVMVDPLNAGPSAALAGIPPAAATGGRRRSGWSAADVLVMAAALSILALSLAGLVWLLRG